MAARAPFRALAGVAGGSTSMLALGLLLAQGVWATGCGGTDPTGAAVDCPAAMDGAAAMDDAAAVDDAADDGGQAGGAAEATTAPSATDRLFDAALPLRTIDLDVAPKDWAWLQAHAAEEHYVPCTVRSDGAKATPAWVRFKGAYGSLFSCFVKQGPDAGKQICKKLSLKVSFNRSQKKGRMFGVRKLILNACNRDSTCLHERLAYGLFRDAGVVAPRAVHVRVRVNGGPVSLYLLVENVDKEFLEDHFADPAGDLYKEVWPSGTTTQHVQAWKSALETHKKAGDVSRLLAFAKAVISGAKAAQEAEKSGPEQAGTAFAAAVDPWIERAVMARYLAVDQLTNNWDGIWKFYCANPMTCGNHNFFLYDDPTSGRFVVVPWDLDQTFTEPNTDMARSWWIDGPKTCDLDTSDPLIAKRKPQCDPLLRGLMRHGWQTYVQHLDTWTTAGGPFDVGHLQARLDAYRAQIYDTIASDPLGPGLVPWLSATAQLRETLTAQVSEVRKVLGWTPGGP